MDKKPTLIGASLQSSLTTIDVICDSYGDQLSSLPKHDTDVLVNLLSQIDKKVNSLSSQILKKDNKNSSTEQKENQSIIGQTEQMSGKDTCNDHSLIESRRHTITSDACSSNDRTIEMMDKNKLDDLQDKPSNISSPNSNFKSCKENQKRPKERRLSVPLLREETISNSIIDSKPVRQRNISILPGPSRFRNRIKAKNSVHPSLPNANSDNSEGNTRRTLSMPVRPVLTSDPYENDDNWSKVAKDAFRLIDVNNDGFLQREEVIAAIKKIKENGALNPEVDTIAMADAMMNENDIDGDGQIDIDEFLEMMRQGPPGQANGSMLSHNNRMSQLAKNVLLAHQKKVENNIVGDDMWMIHPMSAFHAIWDILMSVLIFLTVITMPFALGWEEFNDAFYPMTLSIDILFLIDIGKNFCTGFIDYNDAIIMDARTVRRNYLTGFFLTDLCSCIPFDLILDKVGVANTDTVAGTKNSLKMLKLVRLTKLFRLFRISRLFKQVKKVVLKIEEIFHVRISDGFTKLLRLALGAVVLGHWIGCFNFMLVRLNNFPEDSWVVYAGLVDKGPFTQWSWSFFKALAQMIMIGFETPPFTNASCDTASTWCSIEHWITLACLYIGAVFYSLLISSISSILLRANLANRNFEEKLIQLDDYMRSKKLPASLREKVKDHFHMQHSDGKLFNEDEIFNSVTPILRREIKIFNGRDVTMKVPILSAVTNRSFSEDMTAIIKPTVAFTDEVIMREQTIGQEMYFINSGVIEIFLSGAKNKAYVAIGDGCFFGEVSLLLGIKRTASAKTKTQCVLYKITKNELLDVLRDHPDVEATLRRVARSRKHRLEHYIDPAKNPLRPGDEIDTEDRKTELFGVDAEEITSEKQEEFENTIKQAKVGRGVTYRETIKRPSEFRY